MGVASYLIVVLLILNGINVSKGARGIRRWLIGGAAALALMGFFCIPAPEADLSRMFVYMHDWAAHDFSWLCDKCSMSSTPVWIAYFWLIGQFNVDGLLPAFTGFIYFLLIFSCMWTYAAKEGVRSRAVAFSFLFFMSYGTFFETISGIRSSLVFAVFFWCIYREAVLQKSPIAHLPAYVAAALMHPVGMAVLLFRLTMLVFQKSTKRAGRLAYAGVCVAAIAFTAYYGQPYIDAMLDKVDHYLINDVYSNVWETAIHSVLVLAALLVLAKQRSITRFRCDSVALTNLALVETVLIAVSVAGFFLNYAIFHRFSSFLGMFVSISLMEVQNASDPGDKSFKGFMTAVTLCALVMLALACVQGNLCAYKFMLLD